EIIDKPHPRRVPGAHNPQPPPAPDASARPPALAGRCIAIYIPEGRYALAGVWAPPADPPKRGPQLTGARARDGEGVVTTCAAHPPSATLPHAPGLIPSLGSAPGGPSRGCLARVSARSWHSRRGCG